MRAHSSVISPRTGRARLEDWAERGPAMERQRVSRARLARRVSRRVRRVTAHALPIGIALGTLLAAGLVAFWVLSSPRFLITEVTVTGAGRLRPEDVAAASGIGPGTNFFRLDRDAVVARLETLPLVRRADLVRRFPNQVTLAIEERRPFTLVHAGQLHWIDEQGVNLGPESRAVALRAPVLTGLAPSDLAGDGGVSPRVAAGVSLLRMLLRSETGLIQQISEIDVSRPDGPVLYTVDGVEVRLGADDWEGRLARLQGVLAQLRAGGEAVGAIDLRFRDQVVLKTATR